MIDLDKILNKLLYEKKENYPFPVLILLTGVGVILFFVVFCISRFAVNTILFLLLKIPFLRFWISDAVVRGEIITEAIASGPTLYATICYFSVVLPDSNHQQKVCYRAFGLIILIIGLMILILSFSPGFESLFRCTGIYVCIGGLIFFLSSMHSKK